MAAIVAEAGVQKDLAASQIRSSVSVIDTATNRPAAKRIKTGDGPSAIATSPDGSRVYVVKK